MASTLVFPITGDSNEGWESGVRENEDISDERIVRELVQNALDASIGEKPVEVKFHLINVSIDELPHIEEYRKAYELAKETQKDMQSPTGNQIVERMDAALRESDTQCLICVDNGEGIDESAMRKLYSKATTGKPTKGRGSAGLGHLKPFVTSVLRYIFYAGRNQADGQTKIKNIFGGHAILASQSKPTASDNSVTDYSPNGYICDSSYSTKSINRVKFPQQIPDLIASYMPEETGSAVFISGYKPKYERTNFVHAELAMGAIAKNFLVAIEQGDLSIEFTDETFSTPKKITCNKENLEQVIQKLSFQRNRGKHVSGPPGRLASTLLKTLKEGEYHKLQDPLNGVKVWLRPLLPDEGLTHVAIFREGMWITDECPNLQKKNFDENVQFSCIVNLPTDPEEINLTQLVRIAEGTSHLDIVPEDITNKTHQECLIDLLAALHKEISDLAPAYVSETFEPEYLKVIETTAIGRAQPVPRPKAIPKALDEEPKEDIADEEEFDENNPEGQGEKEHSKDKRKAKVIKDRPKRGNAAGVRTTAQMHDRKKITLGWVAENGFPHGAAGVCVAIPGGSDESSRVTAESVYLKIERFEYTDKAGTHRVVTGEPTFEAHCPDFPDNGLATITLATPPSEKDALYLTAIIVHRKPIKEESIE